MEELNPEQLRGLLDVLEEYRVKKFKLGTMEIEFDGTRPHAKVEDPDVLPPPQPVDPNPYKNPSLGLRTSFTG